MATIQTEADAGTSEAVLDAPRAGYRERVYENYVSAFKGRPEHAEVVSEFERRGRVYDHLLADTLKVCGRDTMLEVACGQGAFLHWALRNGFREVHGCDLSAEQVDVATEMGLPATVAHYRDYLLQYRSTSDLVVGIDIIEHLTRDEAFEFLALCFAAMRPNGHLVLTMPNGAAWRPGPVQQGDLTHETAFSPASISVALKLAGFNEVQVSEIPPLPLSWLGRARRCLWKIIRLCPQMVDIIETGSAEQVLTRVMIVRATRTPLRD